MGLLIDFWVLKVIFWLHFWKQMSLYLTWMFLSLSLCSGSHFNPPFTIAIWLCGGIQLTMAVPYLISQLIGGVLGAAMSKVWTRMHLLHKQKVIYYSHNPKHYSTTKCILKVMTSHKNYVNATGAAFTILKSEEQLGKVVFAEMAMTCLVTMVVLLGAVNGKSKSPLVPFMVGCTVIVNILAGWVWNVIKLNNRHF